MAITFNREGQNNDLIQDQDSDVTLERDINKKDLVKNEATVSLLAQVNNQKELIADCEGFVWTTIEW